MTGFRCELLSADQLSALAQGPLPNGVAASEPRRSLHRDLYLDTPDDTLRRRGVVCRLRTLARGDGLLTLVLPAQLDGPSRIDIPTNGEDLRELLSATNAVVRRLRGMADPAAM